MLTLPSPMVQEKAQNPKYTFPMSQFGKSNSQFQMDKVLAMVCALFFFSLLLSFSLYVNWNIYSFIFLQLGCQAVSRWADTQENLQESVTTLSKNHFRAMFQVFHIFSPNSESEFTYLFSKGIFSGYIWNTQNSLYWPPLRSMYHWLFNLHKKCTKSSGKEDSTTCWFVTIAKRGSAW